MGLVIGMGYPIFNGTNADRSFFGSFGIADLAYSLQSLDDLQNNQILAYRSSDDAERSFTPNEILNGTLTAWVGPGNDGRIKSWGDIVGNFPADQNTITRMPKIVDNGTLVLCNGLPAISANFDSVLKTAAGAIGNVSTLSIFMVFQMNDLSGTNDFLLASTSANYGGSDDNLLIRNSSTKFQAKVNNLSDNSEIELNQDLNQNILSFIYKGGVSTELEINGVSVTDITNIPVSLNLSEGMEIFSALGVILGASAKIQEIIIYKRDQTANKANIIANINQRYAVY